MSESVTSGWWYRLPPSVRAELIACFDTLQAGGVLTTMIPPRAAVGHRDIIRWANTNTTTAPDTLIRREETVIHQLNAFNV